MQHRVSDLFHLQMGKTPSRNQLEYWENGSNKWISISDLSNCSMYTAETKEAITDCAVRETNIRLVPKNTVIMSFKLSIGKTAITSEPVYTNEAIMAFINKGEELVLPEFLYYQLLSKDWGSAGNRAVMGTTLNKASLSKMKIYVPSLQEQRDIVQVLGHIDSQLKRTNESVNKLDDLVKSRFIEMFGEEHQLVELSEVCETFNGDRSSNYPSANERIKAGIPFVNAGNLTNGAISFNNMEYVSEEKYRQLSGGKIQTGDLLYCLRGSLGKCALADFDKGTIASSLMIIRCNQERIQPKYLYETMVSPFVERQMASANNGSSQPNLSAKSVQQFKIPLPPLALQQEFADFVSQVDKLRFGAC